MHSADFARQCVSLYEELANRTVKHYRTPHVDEGSLVATDEADRGQISNVAAKFVMKFMWLARISRPDLMVAIDSCASHITKWTINDDNEQTCWLCCGNSEPSCRACSTDKPFKSSVCRTLMLTLPLNQLLGMCLSEFVSLSVAL